MATSAVTNTFRAPLTEFITASQAVLPHISKDDVTPVITCAKLTQSHMVASDRYTIGSWEFERPVEGEHSATEEEASSAESILVPREAVEWISKIVASKLRHKNGRLNSLYEIQVTQIVETKTVEHAPERTTDTLGDVTVSIVTDGKVERSQAFDGLKGNFPPVDRLIASWKTALEPYPVAIDPIHLEKVTTFAKRFEKNRPIKMELGENENVTGKPAPMKVTIGRLTAIIQPNLLKR